MLTVKNKHLNMVGIFLLVVFLVAFAFSLIRPIDDPDTFWHLATGRWIAENKTLPSEDPFSFTTQRYAYETYERVKFLLKQYWFGQLTLYGSYLLGGYYGVIGLRIFLFLSILAILVTAMRREELLYHDILLFLVPVGFLLVFYIGDRPNQMTYLFSVACIYLIDELRRGKKVGRALVLLMPLWSNMHGGFILGDILLGIMLIEAVFIDGGDNRRERIVVSLLSIFLSFLNPNHIHIVLNLLEREQRYLSYVAENLTPFAYIKWNNYRYILIISAVLIFLVPILIIDLRKDTKTAAFRVIVSTTLLILALNGTRYIPFLVMLSVPFIAGRLFLSILWKIPNILRIGMACLLIIVFAGTHSIKGIKRLEDFSPVSSRYPLEAVRFMEEGGIRGDIFNTYDIGGYLIWKLWPRNRVFIDGRSLVTKVFYIYQAVISGKEDLIAGVPLWKATLDSYNIRYAVISPLDTFGQMRPLIIRFFKDPEWHLNHVDSVSGVMVFSRNSKLKDMPKIIAYSNVLNIANAYLRQRPWIPSIYVTLAKVNILLGRRSEAIRVLEEAVRYNPSWKEGYIGKLLEFIKKNEVVKW